MKYLYVTELTFNDGKYDEVEEVVNSHGHKNWTVADVSELIEDFDYGGFNLSDDDKGLDVHINDFDELAKWAIEHNLVEYNKENTVEPDTIPESDFIYQGEEYKFVYLIGEVLADFLSDAIDNIKSLDTFPTGLGIDKYEA